MRDMRKAYEQYFDTVYGYLLVLTNRNYDLAEELTQETFYRATKNVAKFRGDCKMSTWLCQIAKYTFYQYMDKSRKRAEVSFESVEEPAVSEEVEQAYMDNEAKLAIYKKIQALNAPMRDVFMLRLTGDLSFREIGDILGKTENWARLTYYRAKQILGKEIQKDEK